MVMEGRWLGSDREEAMEFPGPSKVLIKFPVLQYMKFFSLHDMFFLHGFREIMVVESCSNKKVPCTIKEGETRTH